MASAPLKIVQHNLGRSVAANDQLLQYCLVNIDLALIQEPYTCRGKLSGFEARAIRCFFSKATPRPGNPNNIDIRAAIVVFNQDLVIGPGPTNWENFVHVNIENLDAPITLISGYFKYRNPTILHIAALEEILDSGNVNDRVLIAIDANAFSTRWFSRVNDHRGALVEAFIEERNLLVQNVQSSYTTFSGPRGNTNIDVTLTTSDLANCLEDWRVLPDVTVSDHRVICFIVLLDLLPFYRDRPRFNTKKADWERFLATLTETIDRSPFTVDPELQATLVTNALVQDADKAISRRSHYFRPKPPWWSQELTRARANAKAAAREYRINHSPAARDNYRVQRNILTKTLRNEKAKSWKSFCTTEGRTTWGKLFRSFRKPKQEPLPLMTKQNGQTCPNCDESLETLINSLIPNDPGRQFPEPVLLDYEMHTSIIHTTSQELAGFIRDMKPNRAPGLDCLQASIIKIGWPVIEQPYLRTINNCLDKLIFPPIWKTASLIPILKGEQKNRTMPKSYRPVGLLPVLGKLMEKVMARRITTDIEPNLSGRQFGFTKGKSTLSAIENLLSLRDNCQERYFMSVFLDSFSWGRSCVRDAGGADADNCNRQPEAPRGRNPQGE